MAFFCPNLWLDFQMLALVLKLMLKLTKAGYVNYDSFNPFNEQEFEINKHFMFLQTSTSWPNLAPFLFTLEETNNISRMLS